MTVSSLTDNQIDVSFIVITYNGAHLVDDCLRTLKQFCSGFSYETIVIDNGSFDGKSIENVCNKYDDIIYMRNDIGVGFSTANNRCAKAAKGKYVCLLNDDVLFIENNVKKIVEFAESLNENAIIGCKVLNLDKSLQISIGKFDSLWYIFTVNTFLYKLFPKSVFFNKYYLNYKQFTETTEVDFVKGCFFFVKRRAFLDLGGFDENFRFYGEETDVCYRMKKSGGKVYYNPSSSIIHIGGVTSNKMPWFKYKHQTRSKLIIYRKMFSLPGFLLALVMHWFGLLLRVPVYFLGGVIKFDKSLMIKAYFYIKQLFVFPVIKSFPGK